MFRYSGLTNWAPASAGEVLFSGRPILQNVVLTPSVKT
jgi:hypothetical protein